MESSTHRLIDVDILPLGCHQLALSRIVVLYPWAHHLPPPYIYTKMGEDTVDPHICRLHFMETRQQIAVQDKGVQVIYLSQAAHL